MKRSNSSIGIIAPPFSADPVSWVQRYEVLNLGKELKSKGFSVQQIVFADPEQVENLNSTRLLRLSDSLMVQVTSELSSRGIAYAGPTASVLAECYDKQNAYRLASEHEIECPETIPVREYRFQFQPALIKPRRGSDSLGVRVIRDGRIPARFAKEEYLVQPFLFAEELTVGVLSGYIGNPLRILRPEGEIYSFVRKNLKNTPKVKVEDGSLVRRIRGIAEIVQRIFRVDWAARIDLLYDRKHDIVYFLECDATPLIGATSSFAQSLGVAGLHRDDQLRLLLAERSPA